MNNLNKKDTDMKVTAQSYGQFLINSHKNFTGTFFADTVDNLEHDSVYRFLKYSKLTPKLLWEKVSEVIEFSADGYLIFDDSVIDKDRSEKIELANRQYSGNAHGIITGIGVVFCVYYNPQLDRFYPIDFRIWDKTSDGKTKVDHAVDMLEATILRQIPFTRVVVDSGYSTNKLLHAILDHGKHFLAGVRTNRLLSPDDTALGHTTPDGKHRLTPVDQLVWNEQTIASGIIGKLKDMPITRKVKVFRIAATHSGTEFVITDEVKKTAKDARRDSAIRWNIEEFHRELKQLTGLEHCQSRLGRSQHNHILLAILAWLQLKLRSWAEGQTIYEIKQAPLRSFVAEQWRHPATVFALV
jgi:hypothetical protein